MNKSFKYLMEHRVGRKKGTRERAAQLAPREEHEAAAASVQQAGAIIVDNNLTLSDDIAEGRHGKRIMGMEPVVIVILIFMLCFIAFIAWQISQMPAE